jgi:hypothetical protein
VLAVVSVDVPVLPVVSLDAPDVLAEVSVLVPVELPVLAEVSVEVPVVPVVLAVVSVDVPLPVVLAVVSVEVPVLAAIGAQVTPVPLNVVPDCANTGVVRASAATAAVVKSNFI